MGLAEYAKEVSDPENQKLFREEMSELEAQRGFMATFLQPQPGYVIKTRVLSSCQNEDEDSALGFGKIFINVCSDPNISDASPRSDVKPDNKGRIAWAIPYSTSKPRRDLDKAGQNCMVYDVIFNPNVIKETQSNYNFRDMVNSTALEGVEKAFKLKLDRKRLRFPRLQFKGSVHTSVVRRPMSDQEKDDHAKSTKNDEDYDTDKSNSKICGSTSSPPKSADPADLEKSNNNTNNNKNKKMEDSPAVLSKEPQYVLKYRYDQSDVPTIRGDSDPCRPTSILVEVSLPEMSSAKGIELDVLEHLLTLESKEPMAYKLVLKLPYPVCEDQGSAKFDKSQHNLVVTLPVKAKEPVSRLISTDSGINMEFDEDFVDDYQSLDQEELQESEKENSSSNFERSLPPYTCNIYEGLMVFTINVRNVDSLEKSVLKNENGYYLTFHTMGQGFVPFYYGFCLAFDFEKKTSLGGLSCSLDDLEVEVWDNNMILQLSMPKSGCSVYQVGRDEYDLSDNMALPRLEMAKEKFKLKDKVTESLQPTSKVDLDSDDSSEEGLNNQSDADKERHSSGESNDSAISVTPPSLSNSSNSTQDCQFPSKRFLVIPAKLPSNNNNAEQGEVARENHYSNNDSNNLRGILKRARCLSESQAEYLSLVSSSVIDSGSSMSSTTIIEEDIADQNAGKSTAASSAESKKSVRFNEVVQRQVYRQNSSILGQKIKNMKKAEQKRRKAEQKRRASEGDLPDGNGSMDNGFEFSDSDHITNDSGLASSVDESSLEDKKKEKRLKKAHRSKGSNNKKVENIATNHHHSADLIFNLDF